MPNSEDASLSSEFYVVALRPDGNLSDFIANAKSNSLKTVGDQKYLSHPPHMTLYVGAFREPETVLRAVEPLASKNHPVDVRINGWHSFAEDSLTGGRTLVCDVAETGYPTLRSLQSELIAKIAPEREKEQSQARYRPFFDLLEPHRKQAVLDTGFPFIGSDWIPHLTIASFDAHRWQDVWELLKLDSPKGEYLLEGFEVFLLEDDFPKALRFIPFQPQL